MIKGLILATLGAVLLAGCSNKSILRETIMARDLKIEWYLESYISNGRDFVSVTKGDTTEIVLDVVGETVTDVWLLGDTIYVKMTPMMPHAQKASAFGYAIVLDKTATTDDWQRVYAPSLYKKKH
jgi:hypothetical protein